MALAKDRKTDQLGTPDIVDPQLLSFPVAAATTIWGGSIVATDASGNAVGVTASTALKVWGRCEKQVKNTVAEGVGAAGDLSVEVRQGVFAFAVGTGANALTKADVGRIVYASDDQTVNKTDNGGLWPAAGKFFGLDPITGQANVGLGMPSLYDDNDTDNTDPTYDVVTVRARNVVNGNIADLTAYTVASNAAVNDATLNVEGDVVLLVAQTTAAENGLYVVGAVATGTAPLTRLSPLPAGKVILADQYEVCVSVGTVFGHTKWFNTAAVTIGTTDPAFFPETVTISQALVAGTMTITSIPVLSATKSFIGLTRRVANTSNLTVGGYCTTVGGANGVTAGKLGTASVIVEACVAAGTINNADISTLEFSVHNR
jgi:hypothetical protein